MSRPRKDKYFYDPIILSAIEHRLRNSDTPTTTAIRQFVSGLWRGQVEYWSCLGIISEQNEIILKSNREIVIGISEDAAVKRLLSRLAPTLFTKNGRRMMTVRPAFSRGSEIAAENSQKIKSFGGVFAPAESRLIERTNHNRGRRRKRESPAR